MQFKKFIQIGIVSIVAAASLANALAQPINLLLETPALNNTEIVQIIKQNIPKDDLTYIVKNARAEKNERTDKIYNKIDNLIVSKFSHKQLNSVKNELNEALKGLGPAGNSIKVTYAYATPKEIIDEVAKDHPDIRTNDSSRAENAMDVSKECSISMNLAIDNKGRLFESSELVSLSTEQVSKMSNKEIMGVLKETLLHEASHCALHSQMKDPNFSLKFSDSYANQNPTIVKLLNEKISEVKNNISSKNLDNIDTLNLMTFINYHENFSDVNSSFSRLGANPNAEKIREAKEQLLNVSRLRENTGIYHKTQYAVQYALNNIDAAAKMDMNTRTEFAKEIASDSIMNNMRIVLFKVLGQNHTEIFSNYMVNGLKISKVGEVSYEVEDNKLGDFDKITKEIDTMRHNEPTLGTMSQKLKSYANLMEQYSKEIYITAENSNQENKTAPSQTYLFNLNSYMTIRAKSLEEESSIDQKKKAKI